MPKNFSRKAFERWLRDNYESFKFKPRLIAASKRSFTLAFDGLDGITAEIRMYGEVLYWGDGELLEPSPFVDMSEVRAHDGRYYCELCEPTVMFPSREALWEDHLFSHMLGWVNKRYDDKKDLEVATECSKSGKMIRVDINDL